MDLLEFLRNYREQKCINDRKFGLLLRFYCRYGGNYRAMMRAVEALEVD